MAGDPLDRYPRTPHNRPLSGEFSWSILSHLQVSVFFGEISALAFVSVSNIRLLNEQWSVTALELPGRTTNYDVTALPFRAIKFEM